MKTNPTQCFTKKNEFGFALFGGRLQSRTYTAKDGTNRTVLEVVANNINFCGSKADNAGTLSAPTEGPRVGAPAPEYSRGPGDDFAMIEDEGDLPF